MRDTFHITRARWVHSSITSCNVWQLVIYRSSNRSGGSLITPTWPFALCLNYGLPQVPIDVAAYAFIHYIGKELSLGVDYICAESLLMVTDCICRLRSRYTVFYCLSVYNWRATVATFVRLDISPWYTDTWCVLFWWSRVLYYSHLGLITFSVQVSMNRSSSAISNCLTSDISVHSKFMRTDLSLLLATGIYYHLKSWYCSPCI